MKKSNDYIISHQFLQGVSNISIQRALELDITYKCNMSCMQCNRVLGIFPSCETMSVEQIERILEESASMNKPFLNIRILGGEPTLHPHLLEILSVLDIYRRQLKNCAISLWTNSNGEDTKKRLKQMPSWVKIHKASKKTKIGNEYFQAFLAAPIDYKGLHDEDYWSGCGQIRMGKCGVGISSFGVYVCPVAAAIDRVVGLNIGLKSLKEISNESFSKQCNQLCCYCGHFLVDRGIIVPIETVSNTWLRMKNSTKTQRILLTRY